MNTIVKKPWGNYRIIEKGKNYIIKNICVLPNSKLSLQSHSYRSEHWVVIEGKAEIQIDNRISILYPNEGVFIPKNSKHRLSNNEDKNLNIIEIWYGEKLSEEDIIRFEDIYDRI
tara:strand:- start:305 stop:649 length:345 start_codon:yes stop_codon:yes gene_type:complete